MGVRVVTSLNPTPFGCPSAPNPFVLSAAWQLRISQDVPEANPACGFSALHFCTQALPALSRTRRIRIFAS